MALRYRNLRRIYTLLPRLPSGSQKFEQAKKLGSSLIPVACSLDKFIANGGPTCTYSSRFSTAAEVSKEVHAEVDLNLFIRTAFDNSEGPCHRWLNGSEDMGELLKKDTGFLLLAEAFIGSEDGADSWRDRNAMLEKVKSIQQRYPWLRVIGFQSSSSKSPSIDDSTITRFIMEEYINFPILLSSKSFPEMANGACFLVFKDLEGPPLCYDKDVDLILLEAVKDLNGQVKKKSGKADKLKSSWAKQTETFKEPYACSLLQNLLLCHPTCISADESGGRVFLSDSNHHRVLIFDRNGNILDVIGSSPGFDDGDFDTAKLMRPAASYYHAAQDCLYFVDSENHAIRRADLGRRVLDTLYPSGNVKVTGGLWTWFLDKLGIRRDEVTKPVEYDAGSLIFPWHIFISNDNGFLITNKSFDTLWVMDVECKVIHKIVTGPRNIMDLCGKTIMDKLSCLRVLSCDVLQKLAYSSHLLDGIPYSSLVSSFVNFGDHLIICDTVGQSVLMLNKQTEDTSYIRFSNFGKLGLPYWLSGSLEKAFPTGNVYEEAQIDHIQSFTLFPGRVDMHLAIDVPNNTVMVEPLEECCVLRQTRGAAMEVLGLESIASSPNKVGAAQQWYDELDNLAFISETEEVSSQDKPTSTRNLDDGKVHIDCVVNTSPGTSEVIIAAPLYLKLQTTSGNGDETQEMKAAQIADILKLNIPEKRGMFVSWLLKLDRDLGDLVFTKPLLVKIKLNTLNHPKAENSRDIILTDAVVDVNVSLN